jgi:ferredoxin-type protein NapG
VNRKEFLKKSATYGAGLGVSLSLVGLISGGNGYYQRPPGANLDDNFFLTQCIRCGKCSNACPYDVINMASFVHGKNAGTPYLDVRKNPCLLCNDIPCIPACPTDALDHELTNSHEIRMGVAVITDRDACLALRGIRCEACYRSCPLIDKAIKIELSHNKNTDKHAIFEPVIIKDECTGCGICVNACVLEETCIEVLPLIPTPEDRYYFNFGV